MTDRKSAGFTLIELVIVIVILGVLAAVAAPRFIDLSQDAERSSLQAQASALESASAINYAAAAAAGDRSASGNEDVNAVQSCDDAADLVSGGGEEFEADGRFEISGSFDNQGFGDSNDCLLGLRGNDDITDVTFTLIAVP